MNYTAIIVAAGTGSRMGAKQNKIFLEINGIPIIKRTAQIFIKDSDCSKLIIVGRDTELPKLKKLLPDSKINFVSGGDSRQDSVDQAIATLTAADQLILIHDGARCFLKSAELNRLKKAMETSSVALLGIQIQDTLKKVTEQKQVQQTISRDNLWRAQTPQAFQIEVLKKSRKLAQKANFQGTDDVSLVEKFLPTEKIKLVLGSPQNIKITTSDDLILGELIAQSVDD